jgi:hypothetical protein
MLEEPRQNTAIGTFCLTARFLFLPLLQEVMKGPNIILSFHDGSGKERLVTLEPFSGGFFSVYGKDVELPSGGAEPGYIPGFSHDGKDYCFYSKITNGRVLYQDVTPE